MPSTVTTYHLEMRDPARLRPKACPDPRFRSVECTVKQGEYNRFLYQLVGHDWNWVERSPWSLDRWRQYAEADELRTWVGYVEGTPAGYFELQMQEGGSIEIRSFGLAPPFVGKGLGGPFLTGAIRSAWEWEAKRVWVHTCTDDHPHALANYQARGMVLFKTEVSGGDS